MELPDRIEDMTPAQRMHLDMLVDQVDDETPLLCEDREERLAKDPHLAILPSGLKYSTKGVRFFGIVTENYQTGERCWRKGMGQVRYEDGEELAIHRPADVAAFSSALNDIGVYVAAPTLKGDDNDGDGLTAEGAPV